MDLETLKTTHPDVYQAAVQDGVGQERDRVSAHIKLGEASGATDVALKAIIDGEQLTASLQADYMAAGMKRNDRDDRAADDDEVAAAADGAASDDSLSDSAASDEVVNSVVSALGYQEAS